MDWLIIIQALWFVLPAYFANGFAPLVGGGTPIDFGKNYKDGKRILGDGKTWRGLLIGTLIGMIAGFGLSAFAKIVNQTEFSWLGITDFTGFPLMIPIIFSMCFGALAGDVFESFLKRRVGKNRGEDWIPFDQLDFILGVLFFTFLMTVFLNALNLTDGNWLATNLSLWHILVLLTFTPFFHLFSNYVFRKTKQDNIKK